MQIILAISIVSVYYYAQKSAVPHGGSDGSIVAYCLSVVYYRDNGLFSGNIYPQDKSAPQDAGTNRSQHSQVDKRLANC